MQYKPTHLYLRLQNIVWGVLGSEELDGIQFKGIDLHLFSPINKTSLDAPSWNQHALSGAPWRRSQRAAADVLMICNIPHTSLVSFYWAVDKPEWPPFSSPLQVEQMPYKLSSLDRLKNKKALSLNVLVFSLLSSLFFFSRSWTLCRSFSIKNSSKSKSGLHVSPLPILEFRYSYSECNEVCVGHILVTTHRKSVQYNAAESKLLL